MEHGQFGTCLREALRARSMVYRNVKLPSEREFRVSGSIGNVTLWLSAKAVEKNMQDDIAAFEGWAVVLMAWCEAKRIAIDWEEPETSGGHYRRFLYRVGHFAALLGPDVVTVAHPQRLAGSQINGTSMPTLNLASGVDSVASPSRAGSEADLEKRLAGADPTARAKLMSFLGLKMLDRQMPVGVFNGPPTRAGAIFTGGKSAIDLVGVGKDDSLWLLELKTASNIKVGALSELFFYSMIFRDAQLGVIKFHDGKAGSRSTVMPTHVINAPRIHARILSGAVHPLLGSEVFSIMTNSAHARGWPIDFAHQDLQTCLAPNSSGEPKEHTLPV